MSKIEVDTIDKQSGSTVTVGGPGTNLVLGTSGQSVTLGCGATQSGFGRTGTVNWCTTAKTSPLTGVSGNGYFINTTGGAITVTLPSSPSAGDIIAFSDYANQWGTNNLILCRNSSKINGGSFNSTLATSGLAVTLVYVDGTRGWKQVNDATEDVSGVPTFISAEGGTITTSGDFKIHKFTSSANFTVNSAPTPANNNVSYMVVAGGASGGVGCVASGGGGAGGFREGQTPAAPYTGSPLKNSSGLPVAIGAYPVAIGAGGAAITWSPCGARGANGSVSTFSSITSAGGGAGGAVTGSAGTAKGAQTGGSGGGAMGNNSPGTGAAGNTPPTSPAQGFRGGNAANPPSYQQSGGGGGATAQGQDKTSTYGPVGGAGGNGGAGATTEITASPVAYAGGGGGSSDTRGGATPAPAGSGGTGGGGAGAARTGTAGSGTANTGGGGGGGNGPGNGNPVVSGAGGSGVVVIRYKFQ